MRLDPAELEDDGPKPWVVHVTRSETERLSPDTFAFLEYRGPRDQEIVRRMYSGHPTLGAEDGAWGTELVSWRDHLCIFNATEDKDLFTDPSTGRAYIPESVLGHPTADAAETAARMRERGLWPVFEGKHIDQWLFGTKPIRWWLSAGRAEQKYGQPPRPAATLVFRETASNTNERTCIAAMLPPQSAASHKLTGVLLAHTDPVCAMSVLNSLCFDFALRLRTAGTNVSFTYILPMPVPPAAVVNRLPKLATRSAWQDHLDYITEDRALWPLLWQINRAVIEAYGLTPDDFEHILASFPVLKRKRPEFLAYFEEQLAHWREAVGATAERTYPPEAAPTPAALAADAPREPDSPGEGELPEGGE
jgi:hypothetical protein